jgi:hypothetical protein
MLPSVACLLLASCHLSFVSYFINHFSKKLSSFVRKPILRHLEADKAGEEAATSFITPSRLM